MESYWNHIYCQDSRDIGFIPGDSVSLTFTSPMYWNAGMAYDGVTDTTSLEEYTDLHERAWQECFRVTEPGGRICVVIANTGRQPYTRLTDLHAHLLDYAGWICEGEIIWSKGPVFGTAWGSWRRPTKPRLRDIHEYILVYRKLGWKPPQGPGDISADEFCAATQSVWEIRPASAKKANHPAPFPVKLAERAILLYTYPGDIVLDPFCGIGSALIAAETLRRRWIGVDIVQGYCDQAAANIEAIRLLAAR